MTKKGTTKTKGTYEWCDYNLNYQLGCSNDCDYCYAKWSAKHYGRIEDDEEWKIEVLLPKNVPKRVIKTIGKRYMISSTHDITLNNYQFTLCCIEAVIRGDNKALVTSKPRLDCIKKICNTFDNMVEIDALGLKRHVKANMQFRFTITTNEDSLIEDWEGKSPLYKERFDSLKYAWTHGYRTSISMEPYLGDPLDVIYELEPYVNESIWIGPMNKRRLTPRALKHYDREKDYLDNLYSKKFLTENKEKLIKEGYGKIRFKDSVQNLLGIDILGNPK